MPDLKINPISRPPRRIDYHFPVGFDETIFGDYLEYKINIIFKKNAFKIVDEYGNESSELKSWFAFRPHDSGPLLFGMKSIVGNIGFSKSILNPILTLTYDQYFLCK